MQQSLLRAVALGFAQGAVYGAVISILHLRLNGVSGIGQALGSLLFFVLLYSLPSAVFFLIVAAVVTRFGRGGAARLVGAGTGSIEERTTGWALFLFTLVFWELALLYGLTYDQVFLIRPRGAFGMIAYLAVAAGLIALGALLATRMATFGLRRAASWAATVEGRTRLRRVGVAAVALVLGLHLGLPWLEGSGEKRSSPETEVPRSSRSLSALDVVRVETGVKVVVVGLDGLDPHVLDTLIARDQLARIAKLRARGVSGRLATLPAANSAVIWASIYTGHTPASHGVHDFYRIRVPLAGALYPVHRTYFKEAAGVLDRFGLLRFEFVARHSLRRFPYWEIADHFGLSIGVVDGYLFSFPAPVPDTAGSYFTSYGLDSFAHLLAAGEADVEGLPLRLQPVDLLSASELPRGADFEWQSELLLRLLEEREQPALVNLYAHEPDAVQHAHWRQLEPEKYLFARGDPEGGPVAEMHRAFDDFLGRLAAMVDERTAVLVVSDHGHSPTLVHRLDTQHRHGPAGAMILFGGPFRGGLRLEDEAVAASVYDVFPTVLHLLGLPVPEDVPGRVLVEALDPKFRERWPVRTIASYEGLWQPAIREVGRDRTLNEIEIEKLRSMGYL